MAGQGADAAVGVAERTQKPTDKKIMDKRPYFSKTVEELTDLFEKNTDRPRIVKALLAELSFRSRPKAKKLAKRIEDYQSAQREQKQSEEASPEQIRLPIPEKLAPPKQIALPIVTNSDTQENTKEEVAEGASEAPKHSKWQPIFLIAILLVVGLGIYAYWHRNNYPQIYHDNSGHYDVDKQLDKINSEANTLKE